MLTDCIKKLIPNREHRPHHVFFVNRGYLELAKEQGVDISNLIQQMRILGVCFLGTAKNSLKYPFYFVELNEDDTASMNGRAIMQLYVMRNAWTAISRNPQQPHDIIQAFVFSHGQGKTCAARLCTSIPEATKPNQFMYESSTTVSTCVPHGVAPHQLPAGASISDQIDHTFQTFEAGVYRMTRGQGGPGWLSAQPWCFTSTTFHTAVNVPSASYICGPQLKELHRDANNIIQRLPASQITLSNMTELEDIILPSQRNGLHAVLGTSKQKTKHSNTTAEYWLTNCSSRKKMVDKCNEHDIGEAPNCL